jgi:hypothetical protein
MRVRPSCDDVTRELAAPTADRDPAALAEHLAACPHCAHWAARDARLTRLWEATRPDEPSGPTWDALWAEVIGRLDRAPAGAGVEVEVAVGNGLEDGDRATVLALPARPAWRWGVLGFSVAQAAALLVAVGLTAFRGPGEVQAARAVVDIDPGQVALIRGDVRGVHAVVLNTDVGPTALDPDFVILNALEAMAE